MYHITTRVDILYILSLIYIFMESTKDSQWKVVKRILWYIVGITGYGIWYLTSKGNLHGGYTYIDFVGSIGDQKSTYVNAFQLGR